MKISNDLNSTGPVHGADRVTSSTSPRSSQRSTRETGSAHSAVSRISFPARLLARAARELHSEHDVREDAVAAARDQLRNWNGLSKDQLDSLASDLLADLA